jgi:SSS family solute:Na+ symporter
MIWTDVLQCLLLLAGVLMVIVAVIFIDHTGPVDWWQTAQEHAPQHTSPPFFSTDIMVRNTIVWMLVGNFFWTICTHGSDQVVLQRYFSTPSLKAARKSYLTNVFVDLGMTLLLAITGLALLAYYLKRGDRLPNGWTVMGSADKLFPHFLGHELPAGCAGLIMSAFICDAMQTLESGVNAITAVVTNDVVPRLRQGKPRLVGDLVFARIMSVLITTLATSNAFFVSYIAESFKAPGRESNLVDMMPKFFNMFVGPLAALFFTGMFLPRCTGRSAIPAVATGLSVSIFWSWYPEIFHTTARPTFALAIAVPCLVTITTAAVLGLLVERGGPHAGQQFTWIAVVKGPRSTDASGEKDS